MLCDSMFFEWNSMCVSRRQLMLICDRGCVDTIGTPKPVTPLSVKRILASYTATSTSATHPDWWSHRWRISRIWHWRAHFIWSLVELLRGLPEQEKQKRRRYELSLFPLQKTFGGARCAHPEIGNHCLNCVFMFVCWTAETRSSAMDFSYHGCAFWLRSFSYFCRLKHGATLARKISQTSLIYRMWILCAFCLLSHYDFPTLCYV